MGATWLAFLGETNLSKEVFKSGVCTLSYNATMHTVLIAIKVHQLNWERTKLCIHIYNRKHYAPENIHIVPKRKHHIIHNRKIHVRKC